MENKGLGKLEISDLARAGINAVVIAVLGVVYGLTTTAGFDLFSTDWIGVGKLAVNAAFIAFVASIAGSLLTNKEGRTLLGGFKVR